MVFAFVDTTPALDLLDLDSPFVGDDFDSLDWLSPPDSPSNSSLDPSSEPASPEPHALKAIDSFWPEALFTVESDSDSTPTFEKLFPELINELSDSEDDILDGELIAPIKRKAVHDDDDDDEPIVTGKRTRTRKTVQPAPIPKPRRESRAEETTAKVIANLRASSCDSPEAKRRIHNVLERKRRNDLKTNYQELRESIPELETADRAPTGQILMKAVEFIAQLQEQEKALLAGIAAARQENERLRKLSAQ